jgi:hypothetical protein
MKGTPELFTGTVMVSFLFVSIGAVSFKFADLYYCYICSRKEQEEDSIIRFINFYG